MADEKKFIVINEKHLENCSDAAKKALSDALSTICQESEKIKLNKYIVCNHDEPYSSKVMDLINNKKSHLDYVVSALEKLDEKIADEITFLEKHNFRIETMFKREQWQLIDKIRRNISFIDRYDDKKIEKISFIGKV